MAPLSSLSIDVDAEIPNSPSLPVCFRGAHQDHSPISAIFCWFCSRHGVYLLVIQHSNGKELIFPLKTSFLGYFPFRLMMLPWAGVYAAGLLSEQTCLCCQPSMFAMQRRCGAPVVWSAGACNELVWKISALLWSKVVVCNWWIFRWFDFRSVCHVYSQHDFNCLILEAVQ